MDETVHGWRPLLTLLQAFVTAILCGGFFYWIVPEHSNAGRSAARLEWQLALERQISELTANRERESVSRTHADGQVADPKQGEFKQSPGQATAGTEALTNRFAAARDKDAAAPTRNATQEHKDAGRIFDTPRMADAGQVESNQSVGEKKALNVPSAHETPTSVGKPNAEATTLGASSPDRPLNPPVEALNAASETTSSMTAPQDNAAAATQTSSEATPDEITAGVSRRLVGPNQSHLGPLELPSAIPSADEAKLIARAESLFKQSDVVGARLLLEYALTKGSARAAFMMAETYDWKILRSLQTSGLRGDSEIARELYRLAAAAGIEKAQERLEALQSDVTADTRGEGERHSR